MLPIVENISDLSRNKPIGVFDSGIGGLTVLKALQARFPHEDYIYIGDTARLPYGTKSRETVVKYSEGIAGHLLAQDVKAIVVACSTASTQALNEVQSLAGNVPVIGMVEPSAMAAVSATRNGHIGVIATVGTTRNGAYVRALQSRSPDIAVSSVACQMLVALAEEGWAEGDIPCAVLSKYLDKVFDSPSAPDTLILGCTHFPVFAPLLRDILGENVALINTGEAAAEALTPYVHRDTGHMGQSTFYVTDDPLRFAESAAKFFGHCLSEGDVHLMDIR